eukprot:m.320415 g.320415  ORF g.320415 m.320415 type:complete len:488 (+) comp24050_c0_seq1:188-1651(+)
MPAAYDPSTDSLVQSALQAVDKAVAQIVQNENLFGSLSWGVVYKNQLIYHAGYGKKDMNDPNSGAPTANTAFRIGSVSKLFTALMLYQLRDQGSVHLDQTLSSVYPQLSIQNPFGGRGITLKQLACHMSGLPRESPCPNMFYTGCNATEADILERLKDTVLPFAPSTIPSYSNLGFGILGRALEKLPSVNMPWEDYVQVNVCKPLNMNNTGCDLSSLPQDWSVGYHSKSVATLIDLGYEAPAGQLYSSVHDLAQFLSPVLMAYGSGGQNTPILQAETAREWSLPVFINSDGTGFGHPWELVPANNFTVLTKSGDVPGYSAMVMAVPQVHIGAVVLQSSDTNTALNGVIGQLVEFLTHTFGQQIVPQRQQPPAQPSHPEDYVGTFEMVIPNFATMDVIVSQQTIGGVAGLLLAELQITEVLQMGFFSALRAVPGQPDQFMMDDFGQSDACKIAQAGYYLFLQFDRNSTGQVDSLSLPGFIWGTPLKRK